MDFGITLRPDMTPERVVALARQAEEAGFTYGWLFDSHVLWLEPYPLLTMIALNTKRMRLGTCVTNPATRDPTVTASVLATLEEAVQIIKGLAEGRPTNYDGEQIQMDWASGELPVWIAGYGPKALNLAGRIADGVILQIGDPHLIKWCMGFVHEGARAAGRDPANIKVMAATAVWVSDDLATAREHVRWFPALVSNHVMDLVNRYDPAELPPELTGYVRNRAGYDYQHHAEVGSSNAQFVADDVVDRFCIIGTAGQHRQKLQELADAGVTQFNIYLMSGDEEATVDVYGREIVPSF